MRRKRIRTSALVLGIPVLGLLCVAYAFGVEATWLRVRYLEVSPTPTMWLIHLSDLHYKGDSRYLRHVVDTINGIDAALVCFTGDLVEETLYLPEALEGLSHINKPLYGVPGNHDEWSPETTERVRATFQKTGGDWLSNGMALVSSSGVALVTMQAGEDEVPDGFIRILLDHYPACVERFGDARFNLILAGHTHGGQIRIPLLPAVTPYQSGNYVKGLYETPCGPLHVSPGIGTYLVNTRFGCRPEITVIGLSADEHIDRM